MTDTTELGDLVERLRTGNTNHIEADLWMMEAADRIEEMEEKLFSATMDGYDMAKYEYRDRIEELRADAAEARIAHLENHIEAVAKDTHKIMVAAEATLPAVYRLALGDAARRVEARGAENPSSTGQYANSAFIIRRLPTPTAAELMARIQTGEKE